MSNNIKIRIICDFFVSDKKFSTIVQKLLRKLGTTFCNQQLIYLNTKTGTSNAYMNLYFLVKSIQNIAGKYASCRKKRITAGPESMS